MGLYIDPVDMSKEDWLLKNGTRIAPAFTDPCSGDVTVCLVNNGPFTAAAVAYSEREVDAFNQPRDGRPKVWFRVPAKQVNVVTGGMAGKYFAIED